jgi:predicted  nucleic acid-binding Zn-ribbon protein
MSLTRKHPRPPELEIGGKRRLLGEIKSALGSNVRLKFESKLKTQSLKHELEIKMIRDECKNIIDELKRELDQTQELGINLADELKLKERELAQVQELGIHLSRDNEQLQKKLANSVHRAAFDMEIENCLKFKQEATAYTNSIKASLDREVENCRKFSEECKSQINQLKAQLSRKSARS